jgi:hypothetical protein
MKKDIYEPIRRMTRADRLDIYLFAMERSKEILSGKDAFRVDAISDNQTLSESFDRKKE